MKNRKKFFVLGFMCFVVLAIALLVIRMCLLLGLPDNDEYIPGLTANETIEIPLRPGIEGIVITGPIIEPLLFAIDLRISQDVLDWENLNNIEPGANVKIRAYVKNGRLLFDRANGDIKDTGYPSASNIIQNAMKTWAYKPYKEGEIRFWFHLASEREKLIIDPGDLKPKAEFAKYPIRYGKLHSINGIRKTETRIERIKF